MFENIVIADEMCVTILFQEVYLIYLTLQLQLLIIYEQFKYFGINFVLYSTVAVFIFYVNCQSDWLESPRYVWKGREKSNEQWITGIVSFVDPWMSAIVDPSICPLLHCCLHCANVLTSYTTLHGQPS